MYWSLAGGGGVVGYLDTQDPFSLNSRGVVAENVGSVRVLAGDATHLYVGGPGKIAKIAKTRGVVEPFATVGGNVNAIALDEDAVYWTESGAVRRLAKATPGGEALVLAATEDGATALAVDGASVFWTTVGDGAVRRIAKTGGPVTTIARGEAAPSGVAVRRGRGVVDEPRERQDPARAASPLRRPADRGRSTVSDASRHSSLRHVPSGGGTAPCYACRGSMRLAFSFALLASVALSAGALAAGCDPDLTPVSTGTPGAADGGGTSTKPPTGDDGGTTTTGDAGTTDMDAGDAGTPATGHVVDGTNDFAPGETFETSSSATATSTAYTAYVAWDAAKVYFGMNGADIGGTSPQKWLLIYMDGNPGNGGSSTGASFDCGGSCTSVAQRAKLAFSAGFLFVYKTSGDYTRLLKWNGVDKFAAAGFDPDLKKSGNFLELSIPRAVLGAPTTLKVDILMSVESATDAWTYAVTPKTSWTDGRYAPPQSIPKYFAFDLDSTKAPNTFAPLP